MTHTEEPTIGRRELLRNTALATGGLVVVGGGLLVAGEAFADPTYHPPRIYSTKEWKAKAAESPVKVVVKRPKRIIIHHMQNANTTNYTKEHAFQLARDNQKDHQSRPGWIDTGQHFTVTRGGYILEGRHRSLESLQKGDRHVVGSHCPGANDDIGIENEGSYLKGGLRETHYSALRSLCIYICRQYKIKPGSTTIIGHRQVPYSTDCPGKLVNMLPQLRKEVAFYV